jgi:hypothetical protein
MALHRYRRVLQMLAARDLQQQELSLIKSDCLLSHRVQAGYRGKNTAHAQFASSFILLAKITR